MTRPVVALTLGDPAGIGPEIVLKALRKGSLTRSVKLVVIGDKFVLQSFLPTQQFPRRFSFFSTFDEIARSRTFPCFFDCRHSEFNIPVGHISARCGQMSLDYIQTAVQMARCGIVDGIVTSPINKQAWKQAGSKFAGHTEMLAALSGAKNFAMAFFAKHFFTVLVTTHLPLKQAIAALRVPLLEQKIRLTHKALHEMGIRHSRIAVAGVNPHAGEGGVLGDEEKKIFLPAVRKCQKAGLDVSGPYPADTIYLRAARGEFDAVIAPYHDQAMLAVKTLSFGSSTNITLGLPFVRTSVDHGTAFDIAGKGIAREQALVQAILKCRDLIHVQRKRAE